MGQSLQTGSGEAVQMLQKSPYPVSVRSQRCCYRCSDLRQRLQFISKWLNLFQDDAARPATTWNLPNLVDGSQKDVMEQSVASPGSLVLFNPSCQAFSFYAFLNHVEEFVYLHYKSQGCSARNMSRPASSPQTTVREESITSSLPPSSPPLLLSPLPSSPPPAHSACSA
eukprot:761459-Hanusia_phi.AAC.1